MRDETHVSCCETHSESHGTDFEIADDETASATGDDDGTCTGSGVQPGGGRYGKWPRECTIGPPAVRRVENVNPAGVCTISYGGTSVSYTHLRAHETDSYLVCR